MFGRVLCILFIVNQYAFKRELKSTHKMKRLAISYTVLVVFNLILNHRFQLCVGRPDDTKPSNEVQTVNE